MAQTLFDNSGIIKGIEKKMSKMKSPVIILDKWKYQTLNLKLIIESHYQNRIITTEDDKNYYLHINRN